MRKLVAIRIDSLDTGAVVTGYIARKKNRQVAWQKKLAGREKEAVLAAVAESEKDRAAAEGS